MNKHLCIGAHVRISENAGLGSNKTGIIIDPNKIKFDSHGIPDIGDGSYNPFNPKKESIIRLDNGRLICMIDILIRLRDDNRELLKKAYAAYKCGNFLMGDYYYNEAINCGQITEQQRYIKIDLLGKLSRMHTRDLLRLFPMMKLRKRLNWANNSDLVFP
jgi:hypothetical protein